MKIVSIPDAKLIDNETAEAMRYSAFMNMQDISARYLNLALRI